MWRWLGIVGCALASQSWAGSNNYYAYALPAADQAILLDGMKDAGMKVLRTWVTGLPPNQKGSRSQGTKDVEGDGIGKYDPSTLKLIDQLMVEAKQRGIKLLIALHDVNALWHGNDQYTRAFGLQGFYTKPEAIQAFNNRITYILNLYKSDVLGGKPWSELGDYIYGFEAQNEPMIFNQTLYKSNLAWVCNTAKQIRGNVGDPNSLIHSGGGAGSASVQDYFFASSCTLDVISIHDYNDDWDTYLSSAINKAKQVGKRLIVEEWGSDYRSVDRTGNLKDNMKKLNAAGVPWLYWQLITNPDPHEDEDFEIQIGGSNWDTLKAGAVDAPNHPSPFPW